MEPNEPLSLSPEEMRRLGYAAVDLLVEHFSTLGERPVSHVAAPADVKARLQGPVPADGLPPEVVLEELRRDVFGHMAHVDHPRFFAFVPSPSNFVSVLADALAAGFNVFAGSWAVAAGPAEVELQMIDWLRTLCGLPASAGGLFTSGGSVANLTALAVARHVRLGDTHAGAVVYCSDQTHSSIDRGLHLLGFSRAQLRRLPTDDRFRLDLQALRAAVAQDRGAGRNPFCVVANAGTTNTGAVDPLGTLTDYCRAEGLWLHVDGAYGAPALLCEPGRTLLADVHGADSLSLDPHKWLFQPFEIGCVLLRERRHLADTFHILPEYLRDVRGEEDMTNFRDYGLQLTRSFRALKLWMSLRVFGENRFREAVLRGVRLAEEAEACIREAAGWEVVTPAQLGIVSFRYAPPGRTDAELDALNRRLVEAIKEDGFAMLSSTELRGRVALRLCTINPRTSEEDVRETVRRLAVLAGRLG